ncbi:hypothetical protein BYT27DRAFT_6471852 [Phlegmacium glaucopus]|nr:hypothetical protein BYT27DRAFT_6471852 [Phlegmacium glaucopus]
MILFPIKSRSPHDLEYSFLENFSFFRGVVDLFHTATAMLCSLSVALPHMLFIYLMLKSHHFDLLTVSVILLAELSLKIFN